MWKKIIYSTIFLIFTGKVVFAGNKAVKAAQNQFQKEFDYKWIIIGAAVILVVFVICYLVNKKKKT